MPIAFDAASNSLVSGASAPLSHTIGGAGGGLLLVAVNGTNRATAVSYAGVAMTLWSSVTNAATGRTIDVWYLVSPTVGVNNITFTGGTSQIAMGLSYTGVRQSAFPDASHSTASASGTTHSESVTTVADNCWAIAWTDEDQTNATAGASTTQRSASTTYAFESFDGNAAKTPAGSTTLNFACGVSAQWASIAVSIAPNIPSMLAVF